jgi:hypothetical protein
MASVLDICNLALSHIGEAANLSSIDPPEGSVAAELCSRFYAIARDNVLVMHDWGFATRRALPVSLADVPAGWQYAYALPADLLKVIKVVPDESGCAEWWANHYAVESGVLVSQMASPMLVYVAREEDATRYPSLFVQALSLYLASLLAGPIIKGDTGASMAKNCLALVQSILAQAIAVDARQGRDKPLHRPEALRVRGGGMPWHR